MNEHTCGHYGVIATTGLLLALACSTTQGGGEVVVGLQGVPVPTGATKEKKSEPFLE